MRILWVGVIAIVIVLISASIVAHIPGPTPTAQAISNVEHDPTFIANVGANTSYAYAGYSDNLQLCAGASGPMAGGLQFLFPFHSYSTTALLFGLQPERNTTNGRVGSLGVQIDPSTGQIYNIQFSLPCA
jgi:hypothetical protein